MGTNNIVACFSSSIWTKEEKARAESLGFSVGDFKEYPVVSGSVFNEQYNETLDSAVIVLSQVAKEDRLSYIQPYDFVRIYDKSGNTGFDKNYLVDNYNETENNIIEHIFGYTINLMSETKLLEKIQCPSLVITHDVKDGVVSKKSIYQHIKQYMELYVPKIKFCRDGEHWEYEPLIKLPEVPRIEATTTIDFDENDIVDIPFLGERIRKRSQTLPVVGAFRDIDIDSFSTSVSPNFPLNDEKVSLDVWTNSLVYSAEIDLNDIPKTSGQIIFHFDETNFRRVGNTYYISLLSDTLENTKSISVSSHDYVVDSDPSITFSNVQINYRLSKKISFKGRVTNLPQNVSGTITVNYTYLAIDGSVNVNYSYNSTNDFIRRFDFPCADLPFTTPTLRQLLTELMMQVGCIPTVNNRTLGYLDFQKDLIPFGNEDYTVGHTVNKITRGLSSDSYVNTLVNISNQVLDSGNEVICETLGFRDRNNFLLRQEENLFLETNFPIYKVNKCILHAPGKYGGYISGNYGCSITGYEENDSAYRFPFLFQRNSRLESYSSGGNIYKKAVIGFSSEFATAANENYGIWATQHKVHIKDNLIYFLTRKSNGGYSVLSSTNFSDLELDTSNTTETTIIWELNHNEFTSWNKTVEITGLVTDIVGFFFSGYFENSFGETQSFTFIKFDSEDSNVVYYNFGGIETDKPNDFTCVGIKLQIGGTRNWDISKLVLDSQVRNCLDTDFDTMVDDIPDKQEAQIEKLSKYIYGTVGYNIGSNRIEGFSNKYVVGNASGTGWIDKNYTYIENIITCLQYNFENEQDLILDYYDFLNYMDISFADVDNSEIATGLSYAIFVNYFFQYFSPDRTYGNKPYFSTFFVDLYYQPFNSFNLSYVKSKEAIDYSLEQYDGNASGLTDFDRLSIHEQEQVDRVGNETLTISQRTDNYNNIQTFANGPLYFMDDTNRSGSIGTEDKGVKYTIFKRTFSINNNCFNVSYTGSKDAILKDYFTSIRTKYRAYQYVNYEQSTLRKEKDVFYVRIATDYYNGDDRIWWGSYEYKRNYNLANLVYDLANNTNNYPISYECEYDIGLVNTEIGTSTTQIEELQLTKNSVSLISTTNMLGIIYECPDNIGAGPYIFDTIKNDKIGGLPQSWQIWGKSYSDKHTVTFVNYIDFHSLSVTTTGSVDAIDDYVRKCSRVPLVSEDFIDIYTTPNAIFSIVDDNTKEAGDYKNVQRTFYKDASERINHTIQFIYYAPNNDVLFGEDFISGAPMINHFNNPFNVIYGSDSFNFDSKLHIKPDNDVKLADKETDGDNFYSDFVQIIANQYAPVRMIVHWNGYNVIKLCNKNRYNSVIDIAVFKRPEDADENSYTTYFFTINDTKSDYVLAEKDGILYRAYTVQTYKYGNNQNRIVEPIYEDEEGE